MRAAIVILTTLALFNFVSIAGAQDEARDHFGPGEDVNPSFAWDEGASCTFSDNLGVVLRSDWMKRHWIKVAGKQVELNGEGQMSAEGWFQTFTASNVTVTLRLRRVGGEPKGSDGVGMTGDIIITRSGRSTTYRVKGGCGA